MSRLAPADEIAVVRAICRRLGLGEAEPTLLRAGHHTSLALTALGLVAPVQSGEPFAVARSRAARELAVARHLGRRAAPSVA